MGKLAKGGKFSLATSVGIQALFGPKASSGAAAGSVSFGAAAGSASSKPPVAEEEAAPPSAADTLGVVPYELLPACVPLVPRGRGRGQGKRAAKAKAAPKAKSRVQLLAVAAQPKPQRAKDEPRSPSPSQPPHGQPAPRSPLPSQPPPGQPAPRSPTPSQPPPGQPTPRSPTRSRSPQRGGGSSVDVRPSLQAGGSGIVAAPPLPPPDPICCKCRLPLDVLNVQITGKKQGCWKCNRCNAKHVALVRVFGSWPPQQFRAFSEEEQAEFWREPAMGSGAVRRQTVEFFKKRRIEKTLTSTGGRYLPLSVYERLGYDIEAIRDNCTDTQHDDMLGTLYRVTSTLVEKVTEEQWEKEFLMSLTGKPKKKVNATLPDEPQVLSSQCSSTTTTSSSSSSSKRVRRKGKKDKTGKNDKKDKKDKADKADKKDAATGIKEMKKKMEAEKKKSREEAKARQRALADARKVKTDCAKVIAKISPLLCEWMSISKDAAFDHVPSFAKKKAKDSVRPLEKLDAEAHGKLDQESPTTLSVQLCDVADMCTQMRAALNLVREMIQAARRHVL